MRGGVGGEGRRGGGRELKAEDLYDVHELARRMPDDDL